MTDIFLKLAQINRGDLDNTQLPTNTLEPSNLQDVLSLVFGIAAAIAFLIIVIAAFQYVLSQGNPQATAKAKNAIIYAFIGMIICITAFSIVRFVVIRL